MAIATGRSVTVSSSASSDWIKLTPGTNRVFITCASWSTSVATVQISPDASTVVPLREGITGTAAATNSRSVSLRCRRCRLCVSTYLMMRHHLLVLQCHLAQHFFSAHRFSDSLPQPLRTHVESPTRTADCGEGESDT